MNRFAIFSGRFTAVLIFVSILSTCGLGQSAEAGLPLRWQFGLKALNASPLQWAAVQDADGVLHFANNEGVLSYDGARWSLTPTPNPVRSLALGKGGVLFVGSKKDFGVLKANARGQWAYESWAAKAGGLNENIGLVAVVGENVVFVAETKVVTGSQEGSGLKALPLEARAAGAGFAGQQVFINTEGKGVFVVSGSSLSPLETPEALRNDRLSFAASMGEAVVLGSANSGLFAVQGRRIEALAGADAQLKTQGLVAGVALPGGQGLLVGTYASGAAEVNAQGQIVRRYAAPGMLGDNAVYSVFVDAEGNRWVATTAGLTQILAEAPVLSFAHLPGIGSRVNDLEVHQGSLFVATLGGLFKLGTDRFERVANLDVECWDLLSTENGLLVATSNGVMQGNGNNFGLVGQGGQVALNLSASRRSGNLVYAGTNRGVLKLSWDGHWAAEALAGVTEEVNSVLEAPNGLWLGTNYEGLLLHNNGKVQRFGRANGLSSGYVRVLNLGRRVLFQTTDGVYGYVPSSQKFVLQPEATDLLAERGSRLSSHASGGLWLARGQQVLRLKVGEQTVEADEFSAAGFINERISALLATADAVWVAEQNQVYRASQPTGKGRAFKTLIRQVRSAADSLLQGPLASTDALELSAQQRSFQVLLGTGSLSGAGSTEYRYRLSTDEAWSAWSPRSELSFTNLPAGEYALEVQARNGMGQEGEVAKLSLSIAPPWYQTWWAFALLGLAVVVLVGVVIRLNARRLAVQNRRLEETVQQRTAEVNAKQKELQEQNVRLEGTLNELKNTQSQLVHSEKMAALGQLVAGVAHEINTPIGAINASVVNLSNSLAGTMKELPEVFSIMNPAEREVFFKLIDRSVDVTEKVLSSREERQLRKTVEDALVNYNVGDSAALARALVKIGVYENLDEFASLFSHPQAEQLIESAARIGKLHFNLTNINVAVGKTQKMVFALKNFSRKGAAEDSTDMVSLPENIETVLTLYHSQLKVGVKVEKDFQENLPLIECFPDQLNQVWTNIIHNSIQAMKGSGELNIKVWMPDSQHVQVDITDNGPGIPPEIQDRIFEAFFTTKGEGEGSGLGLDITRKIVERHGGKISFTTQPGQTTFHVVLPLKVTAAQPV